jgi:hypothetical protein
MVGAAWADDTWAEEDLTGLNAEGEAWRSAPFAATAAATPVGRKATAPDMRPTGNQTASPTALLRALSSMNLAGEPAVTDTPVAAAQVVAPPVDRFLGWPPAGLAQATVTPTAPPADPVGFQGWPAVTQGPAVPLTRDPVAEVHMAVAAAGASATAGAAAAASLVSQVVAAPKLDGLTQPAVRAFLEQFTLYQLTCSMSNVRQSQLWQLLSPALLDAVPSLAASMLRIVLPPFRSVVVDGGALAGGAPAVFAAAGDVS